MAVAGYGLVSVLFLRRRGQWGRPLEGVTGLVGLLVLAWGWHAMALMERGFTLRRCPVTNLFEAVLFVSWLVGGVCVVAAMRRGWRNAGLAGVMFLAGVGLLALHPVLDRPGAEEWEGAMVSLHVTMVLLAYAAFAMAALAGLGWLWLGWGEEGEERRGEGWPVRRDLERVLTGTLVAGVVLMTAGLGLSFGLVRERYGVWWISDMKIGWSLLVLAIYGGLAGWRLGHRTEVGKVAWGAVMGGVFLGLTFWGTNLLSRIHEP